MPSTLLGAVMLRRMALKNRVVVSPNCRASRHIGKDGTVVSVGRQIEIQLYSDELVKVNRNELHKASPVSSPRNDQELEFQLAEDSVDYISELAASHARLPGSLSENLNRLATECATSQFASPLGLAPPVEAAPVRELNDGATALSRAREAGHVEVVRVLHEAMGCQVRVITIDGQRLPLIAIDCH